MTKPENFISRWARMKGNADPRHAVEEALKETPVLPTPDRPTDGAEAAISPKDSMPADAGLDPARLPSIDAITATTDIRAFLQRGVPGALTRAALRQAWASDPAIRDFIGIAENQWDFNDPNAIPGFGPPPDHSNMPDLLARALGRYDHPGATIAETRLAAEPSAPAATDPEPAGLDQVVQPAIDAPPPIDGRLREDQTREGAAAGSNLVADADEARPNRRSHGSALPR